MSKKLDVIVIGAGQGGWYRNLGLATGRVLAQSIGLTDMTPRRSVLIPDTEITNVHDFFTEHNPGEDFRRLVAEFQAVMAECKTRAEKQEARRIFKLKAKQYRWFISTRLHEYETEPPERW